jgi:hypothetical protein
MFFNCSPDHIAPTAVKEATVHVAEGLMLIAVLAEMQRAGLINAR